MALAPRPTYGPGDSDAPARPPSQNWLKRIGHSPATIAIIAVNVIVFLIAEYVGSTEDTQTLIQFGANHRTLVFERHEYWRLVSSMFLHIGIFHLGVNMYFGFGWSTRVEQWFGSTRFLIAYFVTGILASLTSAVMNLSLSAGASGALFGMIGITLAVLYRSIGNLSDFLKDPGVRSTLFNLAILAVLGATVMPLDNWAHGGGLVSGGVMGLLLVEDAKRRARAKQRQQAKPEGWGQEPR